MNTRVTIDTIINHLKDCVESKVPVAPSTWTDAAQKMSALLGDETDKLFELQHELAILKAQQMSDGATAAKAKVMVEAMPEYMDMQKQKARIEQVQEMIRIAKLQAKLKLDEMRAY
jgi:hypothetical protein